MSKTISFRCPKCGGRAKIMYTEEVTETTDYKVAKCDTCQSISKFSVSFVAYVITHEKAAKNKNNSFLN